MYGNIVISEQHEPKNYDEAITCNNVIKWKETMNDENDSLKKTQTWTNPPSDHQVKIIDELTN